MRITLDDLPKLQESNPEIRRGCIVDTNTLFAAAMPLDRLNEWAETAFACTADLEIPVFTNINIRSEFMELQRRVLVPEGLVSLYDVADKQSMQSVVKAQLKSLKTSKNEAALSARLFKFNDQQMKKYRTLMLALPGVTAENGWEQFCADYLHPYIKNVWDDLIEDMGISFIGTREIEASEHFDRRPSWKDMVDLIGRYGMASTDAMITNFFLCSKFSVIITGDEDIAYVVERVASKTKYVVVREKEREAIA